MSGAEALAVIGIIGNTIPLVNLAWKAIGRIKEFGADTQDVPKASRDIESGLLLIGQTLSQIKRRVSDGQVLEENCKALKEVLGNCEAKLAKLKIILEKVIPQDGASRGERVWKALMSLWQDKKVEEISHALWRSLQSLTLSQVLAIPTIQEIQALVENTSELDLTPSRVSTVQKYFLVPTLSSKDFVGREETMAELASRLCLAKTHCRVAVVGLGGVGKTRVALQFADMAREFADMSVFWVYAHNAERLRKTFDDIAKEVDIPGHQDPKADTLQLVKNWLESDASGRWLLIVDNLDDTELLYPSKSHRVRYAEYLPRSENGSILLTTRNGRVGLEFAAARNVLTLAGMDPEESVALLSKRLGNNQSNESLKELAEELGQVPLALVQAASFINQNRESVGRYLQLYRQSDSTKIQLLSDNFEDEVRHGPSKNPIATTWCVSFEYIEEHDPQAAGLLSFISMLANDGVPRFLLPQGTDEVKFDKAIGTLQAFSFISPRYTEIKDAQQQLFDFHRLVRVAMRNWLAMNRKFDTWTASAIEELAVVVDRPELKRYEFSSQCMPHATELLAVERLRGASGPQDVPAIFLKHKRKKRVCRLLVNVLRRKRKEKCVHKGSICPLCTQRILSFVGRSLLSVGDDISAMPFMQRNLTICTYIFGDAHANSLESLFSLVFINRKLSKFETAEILCRKLIENSKPKSGPMGIRTLDGRELLVEILSDLGKDAEAEAVEGELMETCHREMNEMNSCVNLNRLRILAKIFESRGEYNEAAEYQLRVVQGYKATMGVQNLYTIQALNRLALIYFDLERYDEAEDYARLAFNSSEVLWGLNNTYTINYMLHLSRILRWQSKITEADDLADSALRLSAETFGDTHPRYLQHSMVHRDSLQEHEDMTNSTLRVGEILS